MRFYGKVQAKMRHLQKEHGIDDVCQAVPYMHDLRDEEL